VILTEPPVVPVEEGAAAEDFEADAVAATEVLGLTVAKTPPDFEVLVGPETEELKVKVGAVALELLTGGLP
jgi:hypothetical protein